MLLLMVLAQGWRQCWDEREDGTCFWRGHRAASDGTVTSVLGDGQEQGLGELLEH